jgi:hypothetical protein
MTDEAKKSSWWHTVPGMLTGAAAVITAIISMRLLNRSRYPANFWNANFRLIVDGVPRSPTGDLNKVVDGEAAQEGDVEFTFPANATSLALNIRFYDETTDIPLQRAAR